jgi:hypothetical protein
VSEEQLKVARLALIIALLLAGFLMGVAAESLYNDAQSERDERAWRMVGSSDINENVCIRLAQQQGQRRNLKYLQTCMDMLNKRFGPGH